MRIILHACAALVLLAAIGVTVTAQDPPPNDLAAIRETSRNYTDTVTNKTQLIHGSVDKKTQRVAFTVGENTANVVETGLCNLTKDEAPALLHFGKDRTEQWLLVRLKNPNAATGQ